MSARVLIIFLAGAVVLAAVGTVFFTLDDAGRSDEATRGLAVEAPAPVAPAPPRPEPARPAPATPAPSPEPVRPPVEPTPTTGALRIESDVPGTSVFIDRKYLGTAPMTATGLTPGTHSLQLVPGGGFESHSASIEIAAGEQDYAYSFKTIRLDARVDVVHKHGIGSCRGALVATPQGLTYRTDHEDDGFTVPLTNIEVFTVDYLQNRLQIKVRGGRTYNFEDPDGNADRIFVFHRDVEKVRQRRIGG